MEDWCLLTMFQNISSKFHLLGVRQMRSKLGSSEQLSNLFKVEILIWLFLEHGMKISIYHTTTLDFQENFLLRGILLNQWFSNFLARGTLKETKIFSRHTQANFDRKTVIFRLISMIFSGVNLYMIRI